MEGAAQSAPEQCTNVRITTPYRLGEQWLISLRWNGTIGKSRWSLVGEAYGDTYQEAYDRAVENAKESRIPK